MKKESRFLLGVFIILVGILLLLEQTLVIPNFSSMIFTILTKFWPLLFLFFGSKLLIQKSYTPGIILFILGVALLSSNLFNWNFFAILWPVIIIAIGMSMFFRKEEVSERKRNESSKEKSISETVIFWELKKKVDTKDFKGGEVNVAFGDLQLDLRDVEVAKDGAKIHLNCAFGDVDVFVPKNCRVKTSGSVVVGEWKPEIKERDVSKPVIEITGSVLFGSVKVRD